jgi:hypothetical protein
MTGTAGTFGEGNVDVALMMRGGPDTHAVADMPLTVAATIEARHGAASQGSSDR